jgi:ribosomal protein S18 acetylase RimI-like enzyme
LAVIIRRATKDDYRSLLPLFDQADEFHRENEPGVFRKPDGPPRAMEYYLNLLSLENVGFFIAEEDKQIVGFVHVELRETPPIPVLVSRKYAIVDTIVVKADEQRRGIGRNLMQTAHAWAAARDASSVELTVYEFNERAIEFYRDLGYEALSLRMSFLLSEGKM